MIATRILRRLLRGILWLLAAIALVGVLAVRDTVTVGTDRVGVKFARFQGGTQDTVLPPGRHGFWRWDKVFVYDLRPREIAVTAQALDATGAPMTADIGVKVRPIGATIAQLHKQVGPEYVNHVVIPEVEGAARVAAGAGTLDPAAVHAILSDGGASGADMIEIEVLSVTVP